MVFLLMQLSGCLWIGLWNMYNEKLTDQVYQELQEQVSKGNIPKEAAISECERLKAKTEKTNIQCVFADAGVSNSPVGSR